MSTAQASLKPQWKQEVNRRVAEHANRKAATALEPDTVSGAHHPAGNRAAEAAARVAARFANAPSYSEMLAEEARAAVRAAEIASRAALDAQAAAESVLAGIEASTAAEPPGWESREAAVLPAGLSMAAYWEPEPVFRPVERVRPVAAEAVRPISDAGGYDPEEQIRWEGAEADLAEAAVAADEDPLAGVSPQTVHANLIEFPRELVATRKVRPRIFAGPYGESQEAGVQLSIFEVDPGAISTVPAAAEAIVDAPAASAWTEPEWSGIELAPLPPEKLAEEPEAAVEAEAPAAEAALELAPMSRRLLAAVVDGALIAAAFVAAAFAAAANARALPGPREVELVAAGALLVIAALYEALFFTLARATPGMRYARIGLTTFRGERPTRAERSRRLAALLLSVLPLGLGLIWAVFDENRMSWHDRLSQTYLRRR